MTLEEFLDIEDPDHLLELVDGVVITLSPTSGRHGIVCSNFIMTLGGFVQHHQLGWVASNNTGIIIRGERDTLRGFDIAYWSFDNHPHEPVDYFETVPDLAVEVLSPNIDQLSLTLGVEPLRHIQGFIQCNLLTHVCSRDAESSERSAGQQPWRGAATRQTLPRSDAQSLRVAAKLSLLLLHRVGPRGAAEHVGQQVQPQRFLQQHRCRRSYRIRGASRAASERTICEPRRAETPAPGVETTGLDPEMTGSDPETTDSDR